MTTETKPDMVDRLRDEADLCRNEGATDIAVLLDEAADELERLSAQVAQYREDAERYRWLREQQGWPESEAAMLGISPIDFDSVIDKARKS